MPIEPVPEQDPSQGQILLPHVANPILGVWFTSQTVSDVPESIMGWLVAQGYEVVGVRQVPGAFPPTNYFTLRREAMNPQKALLDLCNNYTIAVNDARDINQYRYNQVVANMTEMIDTSHEQFTIQATEQNAQAGIYLADLDQYMDEIDDLIRENQDKIVVEAENARQSLVAFDNRLSDLETNAQDNANEIAALFQRQDADLAIFVNDYLAKLLELDGNFSSHIANVLSEISSLEGILDGHVASYSQQFAILASNYTTHLSSVNNLMDVVANNVSAYVSDVGSILDSIEADYFVIQNDLNTFSTRAGVLVNGYASDFESILSLLISEHRSHAGATYGLLNNLGATELARINEETAAGLSVQIQMLVSKGLSMSTIPVDVTARSQRDRDEKVQLLNDRLNREKLDNQHKLYEQGAIARARTLDGTTQLHGVQQEVLRYRASLVSSTFSLLQEIRNRVLAGKQAIFAAKDSNAKLGLDVESALYGKLQDIRQRTIGSLEQIHQLRDVFAKWENSEEHRLYEQVQQIESQYIAAIDRQHGAKQDITKGRMSQRDSLLLQLQSALNGLISGKERYSNLLMQNVNVLADHRQKAIVQKMEVAVRRLEGWKLVGDQNRALMAYQLDERNKLLVGLYAFVERRDDIAPEWKEMATMIASLGDTGGGWIQP